MNKITRITLLELLGGKIKVAPELRQRYMVTMNYKLTISKNH